MSATLWLVIKCLEKAKVKSVEIVGAEILM